MNLVSIRKSGHNFNDRGSQKVMIEHILTYEPAIRLGFFVGVLILMGIWKWIAPRRQANRQAKAKGSGTIAHPNYWLLHEALSTPKK